MTNLVPTKLHLYVGINQVSILAGQRFLHVGHDAGGHPGQTLSLVDPDGVASLLPVSRHSVRQ